MHEESPSVVPTVIPEPWVDLAAVGKHIGFCKRTLTKRLKEGKLPGHAIQNGGRTFYRFKLSEVDAAVKAGRLA